MKTGLVSLVAGAICALCLGLTYADQFTRTYEGLAVGLDTADGGGALTRATWPPASQVSGTAFREAEVVSSVKATDIRGDL